jgi:hypothetical protein
VQDIVDHFKNYLDQANKDYRAIKMAEARREEERKRQQLREQVEEEERRLRVRNNIRF